MKKNRIIFRQLQELVDNWKANEGALLTHDQQVKEIAENFGAMLFVLEMCDDVPTELILAEKNKERQAVTAMVDGLSMDFQSLRDSDPKKRS